MHICGTYLGSNTLDQLRSIPANDRGLVILGHGLKDIGKKESFAIFLEKSLNSDIIRDILRAFFDKRE